MTQTIPSDIIVVASSIGLAVDFLAATRSFYTHKAPGIVLIDDVLVNKTLRTAKNAVIFWLYAPSLENLKQIAALRRRNTVICVETWR